MTLAERFAEITQASYVAREFPVDKLPEFQRLRAQAVMELTRSYLAGYIEQYSLAIDPKDIYIGIYTDRHAQAFAFSDPDSPGHFIGISVGLLGVVDRMWHDLLNAPGSFPSLGTVPMTQPRQPLRASPNSLCPEPPPFESIPQVLQAVSESNVPEDPVRAAFAAELSALTLAYCVLHEAAHIVGGHTFWKKTTSGDALISEMSPAASATSPADPDFPMHAQALELIADHYAFQILLLRASDLGMFKTGSPSPLRTAWWHDPADPPVGDDADAVYAAACAAPVCLFLLFLSAGKRQDWDHPSPWHRMLWLLQQSDHILKRPDGEPFSPDAGWHAAMAVWSAYQKLGLPTVPVPPHERTFQLLRIYESNVKLINELIAPYTWDAKTGKRESK
jgi:hypothetical protein